MEPIGWIVAGFVVLNMAIRLMDHFSFLAGLKTKIVSILMALLGAFDMVAQLQGFGSMIPLEGWPVFVTLSSATYAHLRAVTTTEAKAIVGKVL